MKRFKNSRALLRAVGVMSALVIIASGVTFAALQSQSAILKGNTIQTAVANLQLSADGTNYSSSLDGYAFGNLIPGGQASPLNGYPVYLKNSGTTPLALKLSVNGPVSNPNAVDLAKVHVILSPTSGGVPQNITLQDLLNAHASGGVTLNQASHIIPTQAIAFMLQVSLEGDAVSGPSATISNLDFNFGATAVN